jgi:hypothetical protein
LLWHADVHVIPEAAVAGREAAGPDDVAEIERYVDALDDPSLPAAESQWESLNRIHIHTTAAPGEVILMWLRPECNGPCDVQLDYDGGAELRAYRWLSFISLAWLLIGLPV